MRKTTKSDGLADSAPKPGSVGHWAAFWCVALRTTTRWRGAASANRMPAMDDVPRMLQWARSRPGPARFLRRCAQLRVAGDAGVESGNLPPPPAADDATNAELRGDWDAFTTAHPAHRVRDQTAQMQTLERELEFASFGLARARERGDEVGQRKYSEELIKFSKAVKEQRLLADKLGIEAGALLPRSEVERIIHAHCFWLMRGIDADLDALCRKVLNLGSAKDARRALESVLLSGRQFVAPFAQAAKTQAGVALPAWVPDTIDAAVADYFRSRSDTRADTGAASAVDSDVVTRGTQP